MDNLEINLSRIDYILEVFGLTQDELYEKINENRKKIINKEEIFSNPIKISTLKLIDKVFNKGLHFYTDPSNLSKNKESSIYFRKEKFNSEINFGDREIIHKIECKINYLNSLAILSNYKIERKLPIISLNESPEKVARYIKKNFNIYPQKKIKEDKEFLQKLIDCFSDNHILVIEFVENWNKKNKTTINGCFIQPNHIIIKRQQKHLKREIFTLVHELGHYLLNKEELDNINFDNSQKESKTEKIENWCNEFAFYFLMEDEKESLYHIGNIQYKNDRIKKISKEKHISRLALWTHLATKKKINWKTYFFIKSKIEKEYEEIFIKLEKEKKRKKELGLKQKGGSPKPILSKLEMQIYENAYFESVIDSYEIESNFKNNLSYFKDIL